MDTMIPSPTPDAAAQSAITLPKPLSSRSSKERQSAPCSPDNRTVEIPLRRRALSDFNGNRTNRPKDASSGPRSGVSLPCAHSKYLTYLVGVHNDENAQPLSCHVYHMAREELQTYYSLASILDPSTTPKEATSLHQRDQRFSDELREARRVWWTPRRRVHVKPTDAAEPPQATSPKHKQADRNRSRSNGETILDALADANNSDSSSATTTTIHPSPSLTHRFRTAHALLPRPHRRTTPTLLIPPPHPHPSTSSLHVLTSSSSSTRHPRLHRLRTRLLPPFTPTESQRQSCHRFITTPLLLILALPAAVLLTCPICAYVVARNSLAAGNETRAYHRACREALHKPQPGWVPPSCRGCEIGVGGF